MFRWFFFIFTVSVLPVNVYAGSGSDFSKMKFSVPYAYDNDHTVVASYLDAVNRVRSKARRCGKRGFFAAATPLKWSDKLHKAASEHAQDMATHNLSLHDGSGKSTDVTGAKNGWKKHSSKAPERGKFHGYTYSKAFAFAENVGRGQRTLSGIVEAWMNSPSHCANIMNPNFKEMALAKGINQNTCYKTYWTLDLGYRR